MIHRNKAVSLVVLCLASAALLGCSGADTVDSERAGEAEGRAGTTYKVGPTRTYKSLNAVASMLAPGDVVELDGNATYSSVVLSKSGTAAAPITIRGMRVNGKRPVLSGGTNTLEITGDHYVLEAIDLTGGSSRCYFHHAHDVTMRDSVVHDCPGHGILGADSDSGSLTLEYTEVYKAGSGTTKHPIYMATDESAHPGSVFRMKHCYVHDGNGGNNVKTRAERNEIHYNWIEGGTYKELELIGPDGQSPGLKREDSDVVGNVFRKTKTQFVVRVGGDGTGDTDGRYRFVNNTFLLTQGSAAAFHLFDGIESIEIHNNVFYRVGGGSVQIFQDDANWSTGSALIAGTNNVVPSGTSVPGQWKGTIVNSNPGFTNVTARDVTLLSSSPLVNAGATNPAGVANHPFPSPLLVPAYHPPPGKIEAFGAAQPRPVVGTIDIGAFEYGSGGGGGGSGGSGGSGGGDGGVIQPPPPPPDPLPAPCETAVAGGMWQTTPFASKAGSFTVSMDVTPSAAPMDGAVALAKGTPSAWTGLAAIVRFSPAGVIDVRKGSTYTAATSMPYVAGAKYHVRMVVNVSTHTYSVYVTPPGGAEKLLASGYGFRTEQAYVGSLDSWVVNHVGASGTLTACNFLLQ